MNEELKNILSRVDHTLLAQGATWNEIKAICDCGAKATVNARLDSEGCIVTEGAQLLLGGNDRYLAMCHKCWIRNIREHRKVKNR